MELAARIGAWKQSCAPLPYDAEVEWLKTSKSIDGNSQYLKIEYIVSVNSIRTTTVRGEVTFEERDNLYDQYIFGHEDRVLINSFALCHGGVRWLYRFGTTQAYFGASGADYTGKTYFNFSGRNIVIINQHETIERVVQGVEDFTANDSGFGIFNYLRAGVAKATPSGPKVHWIKILTNDSLDFDLIPVRFTNENGVSEGAMYDRVSGQLFRNQGTGAFIIGPDVVSSRGGGTKCLTPRRSYRRSSRPSARFCRHSQEWEVAA